MYSISTCFRGLLYILFRFTVPKSRLPSKLKLPNLSGSRGSETRFFEEPCALVFAVSRHRHRFFVRMGQEQIYSETRNSLFSVPARSHLIFTKKQIHVSWGPSYAPSTPNDIRLKVKTNFGKYSLESNSCAYYLSHVRWLVRMMQIFAEFQPKLFSLISAGIWIIYGTLMNLGYSPEVSAFCGKFKRIQSQEMLRHFFKNSTSKNKV